MKTEVNQASLEAFERVLENIPTRKQQVLASIKELGEASDHQILNFFRKNGIFLGINSITPRRLELFKQNKIYCSKVDYDGFSPVKVSIWRIK